MNGKSPVLNFFTACSTMIYTAGIYLIIENKKIQR